MSLRPGHRKFNVTREVISKGTDGKKHFCNVGGVLEEASGLSTEQTIDTGLPLIGSAIKMEWFQEPERERVGDRMSGKGGGGESEHHLLNLPLSCHQFFSIA